MLHRQTRALLEDRLMELWFIILILLFLLFSWGTLVLALPAWLIAWPLARRSVHNPSAVPLWQAACLLGAFLPWPLIAGITTALIALVYALEWIGETFGSLLLLAFVIGPIIPALSGKFFRVRSRYWQLISRSLDRAIPKKGVSGPLADMRRRYNLNRTVLESGGPDARVALQNILSGSERIMMN